MNKPSHWWLFFFISCCSRHLIIENFSPDKRLLLNFNCLSIISSTISFLPMNKDYSCSPTTHPHIHNYLNRKVISDQHCNKSDCVHLVSSAASTVAAVVGVIGVPEENSWSWITHFYCFKASLFFKSVYLYANRISEWVLIAHFVFESNLI